MTTNLRISEAMRLGSMQYPQGFKALLIQQPDGKVKICALGAALLAAGCISVPPLESVPTTVPSHLPIPCEWLLFLNSGRACPECGEVRIGYEVITHLNDFHFLTRERIADWVEAYELTDTNWPTFSGFRLTTSVHQLSVSEPEPPPDPKPQPAPIKKPDDEPDEEPVLAVTGG